MCDLRSGVVATGLALVGALALGCEAAPQRLGTDGATREAAPWVVEAERRTEELVAACRQLSEAMAARTPPMVYLDGRVEPARGNGFLNESIRRIETALWEAWRSTGHCAYADIPPKYLVAEGRAIAERYRKWVEGHRRATREQVAREMIVENIKLVNTVFCLPAMEIIAQQVQTEQTVSVQVIAGGYLLGGIALAPGENLRRDVYESVKKWWQASEREATWKEGALFVDKSFPRAYSDVQRHLEQWMLVTIEIDLNGLVIWRPWLGGPRSIRR